MLAATNSLARINHHFDSFDPVQSSDTVSRETRWGVVTLFQPKPGDSIGLASFFMVFSKITFPFANQYSFTKPFGNRDEEQLTMQAIVHLLEQSGSRPEF